MRLVTVDSCFMSPRMTVSGTGSIEALLVVQAARVVRDAAEFSGPVRGRQRMIKGCPEGCGTQTHYEERNQDFHWFWWVFTP